MDIVLIIGAQAVGKMTVGNELSKITGFRLFHNHMIIDPVLEVFGYVNWPAVNKMRHVVIDEFVETEQRGMVYTMVWDFNSPFDLEYVENIVKPFEQTGGKVYCVELIASLSKRLERNKSAFRLERKPSKRNIEDSERRLMDAELCGRYASNLGEVPFKNYLRVENSWLPATEVAKKIKREFGL